MPRNSEASFGLEHILAGQRRTAFEQLPYVALRATNGSGEGGLSARQGHSFFESGKHRFVVHIVGLIAIY